MDKKDHKYYTKQTYLKMSRFFEKEMFQKKAKFIMQNLKSLFRIYIFRQRVPLFVIWYLTNKCNTRCKYCNIPFREKKELSTKRALEVIDEMAKLGTLRVGLVGGEPLLRTDIDSIVSHAKSKGLMVHLYSNGFLVKQNLQTIKKLDGIFLSLDGPEEAHDKFRGKGSYKKVIKAIRVCKPHTPVFVTTVLTKQNKQYIKYVSDLSKKMGFLVNFQPVLQIPSLATNISDYKLTNQELKDCMTEILKLKRTNPNIALSKTFLKKIINRNPKKQKKGYQLGIIKCWNGRAACHIDSNGKLYSCIHLNNKEDALSLDNTSFKDAFEHINSCTCETCNVTCSVEYNFWLSLKIEPIINILKTIWRISK
ncbi:MAG: radical SAM protein [Nanoarchaeota archaeon]|nr:radical SAM protein [Nanoarchaeota archaeon]